MTTRTEHSIDVQIEYCTWVFTTLIQVHAWTAAAPLDRATHEVLNRQAEIVAAILETLKRVKEERSRAEPATLPAHAH